jgi:polysaccharide export outer membrane protein
MRLLFLSILLVAINSSAAQLSVQNISLNYAKDTVILDIEGSGPLEFKASMVGSPPRIELVFLNTRNDLRKNLTIKNNSVISEIQAVPSDRSKKDTFITIQLKNADVKFSQKKLENGVELQIEPNRPPIDNGIPVSELPKELLIGSEDLLEINVFKLPDFSVTTRVLGDGTITMPLIGSVKVGGLSRIAVERKIEDALRAKYVNNPSVSVNVKEYKSLQVSVLGEVKNPGPYYITSQRTLLQLLSDAGGLTTAAGSKCFVFRGGGSKIEVDLYDLMQKGKQDLNILIHPGDVVNIPLAEQLFVYVLGAVKSPGAIEITRASRITLLAAIARVGGVTEVANKSAVEIKRKDENGADKIIRANLKDILSGKIPDVELFADDVVNVRQSFF